MKIWLVSPNATSASLKHSSSKSLSSNFFFFPIFMLFIFLMPDGQCIAQSQKIGIYNPFSIPALKWDLKSNLNPSFKTLVNLNPCLKMGFTIQSRSLFLKKLHYKRTFLYSLRNRENPCYK